MWTQPLVFGGGNGLGTLVLDIRFEDSPDTGQYVNSAPRGPVRVDKYITGTGALSSAQAYAGTQSMHLQGASLTTPTVTDLTLGTANFELVIHAYFLDVTTGPFGQGLFQFDSASVG